MYPEISVESELAENVLKELKARALQTVDTVSPNDILNPISIEEEREDLKKDITKALILSNSTQRIYFIVRSSIMTILSAIITLAVFWQLGKINVVEDFVLGISLYIISLILSRLLDTEIFNISKNILVYLSDHTKLTNFLLKNL